MRLIFIVLIVSGCRFQPVNTVKSGLVLTDSALPADKAKFYHADEYTSEYPIYYMGPVADTIVLPLRPLSPHWKSTDEAFGENAPWTPADSAQVLKAGEMAIAKLLLTDGDYHTSCRLKFKSRKDSVYSNVFPFVIDRRWLQKEL
ncbi:hypothetical protein [Chitinophaga eiseniae]|uniref:hypothetical protein n=1 Tax=Chitinophaga eiseniae TaxID=634771 RepID=UPI0011786F30|nr:hypothetical protein [Chitinophaga eiseniae]